MDRSGIAGPPAELEGPSWRTRGMLGWVCTNNPFYLLSAWLVCLGLRTSFDPHTRIFQTWPLLGGMAAYTLLLAVVALMLVRFNTVWNDIRTILLLIVLLILSISVTFDDVLALSPWQGRAGYLAGLAFAVALSEGLLRGMRLAMPPWFRVAYHLALGLFFLYPVGLSFVLKPATGAAVQWGLFGFSPLASLLALTLVPAIRRGPSYVAKNGSPWPWPLYPWVLFGLIGLAVCLRSFYLCWSMHYLEGVDRFRNIFGLYFLVPFLFAVAVLLLELGLVARSGAVLRTALAFPVGLLVLSMVGHRPDRVYQGFLALFEGQLGGTPLYLTLVASAGFYGLAALRRVAFASGALTIAVAALVVVGPSTLTLANPAEPRAWPLVAVAVLQAAIAIRRRDSVRWLVAAGCLVAAATLGCGRDWTPAGRTVLAFHLATASALAIGAAFDDTLGRLLRGAGALMMLLASVAAASDMADSFAPVPPAVMRTYPVGVAAVALIYGQAIGSRAYRAVAAASLGFWLTATGWQGYAALRRSVVGLDQIAAGLASLLLAALISLTKAGAVQRWLSRRREGVYRHL